MYVCMYVVVSLAGFRVLICNLYTCGVWVESVDQFLYRTVQSSVNLVLLIVNNL